MIEELRQTPRATIFGQCIFIITIAMFILSILEGGTFLGNYGVYAVIAGCMIGVITALIPQEKKWKFIVFDIVTTAILFISYVQVFSFR